MTVAASCLAWPSPRVAASGPAAMEAVAAAVLFGHRLPPPETTANLPPAIKGRLADYRKREATFRSGLTPPPGATPDEQRSFEQLLAFRFG